MIKLNWNQVHAWRMAQHGLAPRLPRQELVAAAQRTLGLQAQVMSAAELALAARLDGLAPGDVPAALWQVHSLVKTWAMRGTLHLVAASELPLLAAARRVHNNRNWAAYFEYYAIPPDQVRVFMEAVPAILGSQPLTRAGLAEALTRQTGLPALGALILEKSWGTPLKPFAWRGELCFGPSQGPNVTYVNPRQWLGGWQDLEPYPALQEVARRYLRSYGPATAVDFAMWWGATGITQGKAVFRSLADELEPVDVEGWQAMALRSTLDEMQASELPAASGLRRTVRLLPLFDAYVLGLGRDVEPLLAAAYKSQVFRPQGWITATVVVDGSIKGVWEQEPRKDRTTVKIRLFDIPRSEVEDGIEEEAARLAAFWNTKVQIVYAGD